MKTFTKTVLASGLGMFGMLGGAEAAAPYSYGSYGSSSYGVASDGCYVPSTPSRRNSGHGTAYHSASYGRPTYDDRFHTSPYSPGRSTSYDRWDDDCDYGTPSRLPSRPSAYRDRYDGSPLFEPWRPMNASHRPDRRNW